MSRLRLEIAADGSGVVEIDGHDIGDLVAGIWFQSTPGDGMEVVLKLLPIAVDADMEVDNLTIGDTPHDVH